MSHSDRPKRSPAEEKRLVEDMIAGNTRCYYCDKSIDPDDYDDASSTEYGIFWACSDCFEKWGNADQDILKDAP